MAKHKEEVILDYVVKDVFKVFRQTAKRDFSNFNEKKAIGTTIERQVGSHSSKAQKMVVKISDFKADEVYEITSYYKRSTYTSRYEFYPLEENKTKLVLTETSFAPGSIEAINAIIGAIFYKRKFKRKFAMLVEGLEKEIVENLNKSQPVKSSK